MSFTQRPDTAPTLTALLAEFVIPCLLVFSATGWRCATCWWPAPTMAITHEATARELQPDRCPRSVA